MISTTANPVSVPVTSFAATTSMSDETEALGASFGRNLRVGDLVLLYGDLGAGKTCFTRGIARGMGIASREGVSSPTFTLAHQHFGITPLFHCDFYRLLETGAGAKHTADPFAEGIDLDGALAEGVVVVEWPEPVQAALDATRAQRRFDVRLEWVADDVRRITWVSRDHEGDSENVAG